MEIHRLTCQINDKTHRRRFNLFNQGRDKHLFQIWFFSMAAAFLLKYLAGIVYSEEKKLIRANSVSVYFCLIYFFTAVLSLVDKNKKALSKIFMGAVIVGILVEFVLMAALGAENRINMVDISVMRMLTSNLYVEFISVAVLFPLALLAALVK